MHRIKGSGVRDLESEKLWSFVVVLAFLRRDLEAKILVVFTLGNVAKDQSGD